MSLDFCYDTQVVGSKFGVNNLKAWIHPALYQNFHIVEDVFLAQFGPLVPTRNHLNVTACLSIAAYHAHPFMTTVYLFSDGFSQQDNKRCHKTQSITNFFLVTVLKCYTVIMQFHWSGPLKIKVDQSWRYSDTYQSSLLLILHKTYIIHHQKNNSRNV